MGDGRGEFVDESGDPLGEVDRALDESDVAESVPVFDLGVLGKVVHEEVEATRREHALLFPPHEEDGDVQATYN